MGCQVVNSQSKLKARLPELPAQLPRTQGEWTAFLATLQRWGAALQQEGHPPNVIPSQFQTFTTAAASAVIAKLSAVGCTVSVDAATQYYGQASLAVSGIGVGAQLSFSGFPISISPATRWFCSFQILAPEGCTGSLAVASKGGVTLTEAFTVPASADWQQVWGLFDLRAYADTAASWEFTFESTSDVHLDGMQMNAVGDPLASLPRFAGTQMLTGPLAYADDLDAVPDGATYERMPGANMDASRRALIDLAESGHLHKALDYIADGSTYGRALLARLSGGKPWIDFAEGIHQNKNLGNIPDAGGRYAVGNGAGLGGVASWDGNNRALIDFSQTHFNKSLLYMPDGPGRYAVTNGGGLGGVANWDGNLRALIDFSQGHYNKSLDYIGDGGTYARLRAAGIGNGLVIAPGITTGHISTWANNFISGSRALSGSLVNIVSATIGPFSTPQQIAIFIIGDCHFLMNAGQSALITLQWGASVSSASYTMFGGAAKVIRQMYSGDEYRAPLSMATVDSLAANTTRTYYFNAQYGSNNFAPATAEIVNPLIIVLAIKN